MSRPPGAKVRYDDLLAAFDWVCAGGPYQNAAFISRLTGATHWASDLELDDELPGDIDDATIYVRVPHRNELDLGRNLVMTFAHEALPESSAVIEALFRRPGAYRRFKDLLDRRGLLKMWHEYEALAVEEALRNWSDRQGLPVTPTRARG